MTELKREYYTEFTPENIANVVINLIDTIGAVAKKLDFKHSQRQKEMNTSQTITEYIRSVEDAKSQELIGEKIIMQQEGKKAVRYRKAWEKLSIYNYELYQKHLSLQVLCDEHGITDEVNRLLSKSE